jgi:hypothetical protein
MHIAKSNEFSGIWVAWHYVKNQNDYMYMWMKTADSDIISMFQHFIGLGAHNTKCMVN